MGLFFSKCLKRKWRASPMGPGDPSFPGWVLGRVNRRPLCLPTQYLSWGHSQARWSCDDFPALLEINAFHLWSGGALVSRRARAARVLPSPVCTARPRAKRPPQPLWPKMREIFRKRSGWFRWALAQELGSSHGCDPWPGRDLGWRRGWQELEPPREQPLWQFISAAGVLLSDLFTHRPGL